jgi:hypothetical protein
MRSNLSDDSLDRRLGNFQAFWLPTVLLQAAAYVEVPEGYAAFVEELPGANAQGATLEEARENMSRARQAASSIIHAGE